MRRDDEARTPEQPDMARFGEYVAWLVGRDDSDDEAYWTKEMARFPGRTPVVETLGRPRREGGYDRAAHAFPDALVADLHQFTRAHGVTPFTVLQGAWTLTLAAATGTPTITFGVVCSGRPEHLTGMAGGVASFFQAHRGHRFVSSALMDPISKNFIAGFHRMCRDLDVPMIDFVKGQRKDDVALEYLARFAGEEGVLFVGRAQEKTRRIRGSCPARGYPHPA